MEGPLLTASLDLNVRIVERLQYNRTPEEKKPFIGMSPTEALDMTYELSAQANICMNYATGSTKSLVAEELDVVRQDLETTQKENTELSRRLKEL